MTIWIVIAFGVGVFVGALGILGLGLCVAGKDADRVTGREP